MQSNCQTPRFCQNKKFLSLKGRALVGWMEKPSDPRSFNWQSKKLFRKSSAASGGWWVRVIIGDWIALTKSTLKAATSIRSTPVFWHGHWPSKGIELCKKEKKLCRGKLTRWKLLLQSRRTSEKKATLNNCPPCGGKSLEKKADHWISVPIMFFSSNI